MPRGAGQRPGGLDRAVYRTHHRVKQFRRIATRYAKPAENCRAMRHIGSIRLRWQFAHTPWSIRSQCIQGRKCREGDSRDRPAHRKRACKGPIIRSVME